MWEGREELGPDLSALSTSDHGVREYFVVGIGNTIKCRRGSRSNHADPPVTAFPELVE